MTAPRVTTKGTGATDAGMKAPRSTTTLGTGIGAEDAVLGGIAAVSLSFGAGLLAVALALPLYWLPGQLALLCLLLPALAGIGVVTARRLAGLIGIAAADFAIRVRLTRWIVVGMSMAALPLAEAHLMGRSVNAGGLLFTIAVSVAACWVVSAAADGLTRAWATLQVQPWETTVVSEGGVSAVSLERAGRVDRGKILHDLWRGWLAGEVGLAVALLIRSQLVQGHEGFAWASLLAFGIYTLAGLLVLSQAARARQTIQWQLSGLAVPPELEGAWSGAGIRAAAAAMLGIGLLLLVHALDLAHGIVNWVAVTLLLPLLGPLGRWFEQLGNQVLGNCANGRCGAPSAIRKTPPPPRPPPPLGHHAGGPDLGWLVHAWPAILAILVIGVVVRLYWGTRGSRGGRGIWEEMLAILSGNLRRLFRLFRQPARLIAARIGARALEPGQRRFRLPRRRDQGAWATSRQAIIGLYLAALAQAARRGHPRRPGQTPAEYATELTLHLPDSDDTLGRMTELFTAVRYGEEPADPEAVGRMRGWWAAFRDLLRGGRASNIP